MGNRPIKYDMDSIPHQRVFHESIERYLYLSCGLGGGKTYSLIMKMFQLMHRNRGLPGAILCPTLKMYRRDVRATIKEICDANRIPYVENKADLSWYFPETRSIVYIYHSQDDGESIRGPNLAWGLINEVTLCTENAYKHFIARVRLAAAPFRQVAMSGTPEQFNWAYEYFISDPKKNTKIIYGRSTDNVYVAADYFQGLRDSFDPQMCLAYIEGKFVNLLGKTAVTMFNRRKHVRKVEFIKDAAIAVTCDFNVSPMAATLWNVCHLGHRDPVTKKQAEKYRAFGEINIEHGANTYMLCDAIKQKLPGIDTKKIVIFPDAAGRGHSTKTQLYTSDLDILKDYGNFTRIRYRTNARVRDGINATNNVFQRNLAVIDSSCKETISDFEQCQWVGDRFDLDKKNPKRTHWLDGSKGMFNILEPVRMRPGARTHRIR